MKTILAALLAGVSLFACSSEPSQPVLTPPNEQAAIDALKQVNQAQADFIRRTRRYAQTYDELIAQRLLNAEPTKAATGYDFLMLPSPDAVSYTLTATPSGPGARHFFTDQSGVLRASQDKPATAESPAF
jgi:hypothetical protein